MTYPPIPLSLPRTRIGLSSAASRDDHHRDILFEPARRAFALRTQVNAGDSRPKMAKPVGLRREG
jgi:hypothetical protein